MTQLRIDDLPRHLEQRLAPVYLVAGEEPLLIEEALGRLRAAARKAGHTEREVLVADNGFDWSRLRQAADNLSLFGDRRLLELRVPGGKTGQAGGKALQEYCKAPPDDTVLLVITERLDNRQRRSGWAEALARAGAMIYVWPVGRKDLPRWVQRRMGEHGMRPDRDAVALIAERAEGNLLAASQEIEKLALLLGDGPVTVEQVREAVSDSARYDVFALGDAAVGGEVARVARVMRGLREESTEPTLVLWALARDLRVLAELQAVHSQGGRPDGVFRRHRIPRPRQGSLWQAAIRPPAGSWEQLLGRAALADRTIKGVGSGRPWDELLQLGLEMANAAAARQGRQRM